MPAMTTTKSVATAPNTVLPQVMAPASRLPIEEPLTSSETGTERNGTDLEKVSAAAGRLFTSATS